MRHDCRSSFLELKLILNSISDEYLSKLKIILSECERGSVINSLTKNCERCPNGTYGGGSNNTKCHPCPIGKTSYQGSSAHRDCHWSK